MLLDFPALYNKYNLNIKGVIHIGAHYGQEHSIYKNYDIKNILYFEPQPQVFEILKNNIKDNSILVNKALGNENKKITMNVESANNGQSSSILNPKLHKIQYPHIVFENIIEVDMIRLDEYDFNEEEYNFINIDVQGYELEVFKGAEETLNHIDYIITEVNRDEVYEGCARVEQLDIFLAVYGFKRVETSWDGVSWGDAFYLKQK